MVDTIYRRRSVRSYTDQPVENVQEILDFIATAKPLYPDIQVQTRIVGKDQVRFYMPWKSPQLLAIYSENKPGYLENVGFLFQQVDLYLQSKGLGSCWMGLGKVRERLEDLDNLEFVILMAFGWPKHNDLRSDSSDFKRNAAEEIADYADPLLEPARLAPSSTNSQPWYFVHCKDSIHVYRNQAGLLRHKMLGTMNQIDIGIALAHLYVTHPNSFHFFTAEAPQLDGKDYVGSISL
jgi:nitroreductase